MGSPRIDEWDAAAEEKRFRESLRRAREADAELGEQLSRSSPNFQLLSVAEIDATEQILESGCFASPDALLAELRRLIAEPVPPSRHVPSIQAYRDSQKWWLESMLQVYERGR